MTSFRCHLRYRCFARSLQRFTICCGLLAICFSKTTAANEYSGSLWRAEPDFVSHEPRPEDVAYGVIPTSANESLPLYAQLALPPKPPTVDTPMMLQKPADLPAPKPEKKSEEKEDQSYGEQEEDQSVQFLRTASVLLKPGQWQFDYGLVYVKDNFELPISLFPSGVAPAETKRRLLQVPFAVRYGWNKDVQLSASLPVGWSQIEFSSPGIFDEYNNNGGIGDLQLGVNYHWLKSCGEHSPDVILNFGLSVPTGDGVFATTGVNQATLANAVWAPSIQVLCVQRYDPIVLFYGVGYQYQFEREFSGVDVQYGQQFSYNFGVGFAVNDTVTLSTSFLGLAVTETEVNGQGVPGTIREPMRARFAVTASRCKRIIEPFLEIGMTNAAADSVVGIVWTR
ncbi:transporter [Bremerella sp. T1]|uniref:transporter n=1 Tax=Bremerella sp. TYQ1 TaxID=3119568 RepID=UPI001CCD1B2D|nr:transporter [Bremerella volcania]UBM35688.1 transporter [Bremerella volcania]